MAKFIALFSLALTAVAYAAPVSEANSLEARWFPTCGLPGLVGMGTHTGVTLALNTLYRKGEAPVTADGNKVDVVWTSDNRINTYVQIWSASGGSQTATYNQIATTVTKITYSQCTNGGCETINGLEECFVEGSSSLEANDNFVVRVYGDHM